jgi:hypothetical protein
MREMEKRREAKMKFSVGEENWATRDDLKQTH